MQKKLFSLLLFVLCFGAFSKVNAQCQSAFVFSDTTGTYYFADSSSVPGDTISAWAWTFGDAGVSSAQNPNHIYASCGMYIVTLSISTLHGCNSTFTDSVYVPGAIAGSYVFSVDTMNGNTTFTGSPNNPNYSYAWNFSDAASTATGISTSHTYSNGTYNACLIITDNNNACTADTVCQSVLVSIYVPPPCAAGFTFTQSADTVMFADASTAPSDSITSWNWNFGDASSSNLQNPTHVYPSCGTFTVSLSIQTNNSCSSTFSDTITIGTAINGSYVFSVDTMTGNTTFTSSPNNVNYSYAWDFGDTTNGSGANTSHTYSNGTHIACVIISDNNSVCASDTVCQNVVVNIYSPAPCAAGFTFTQSTDSLRFTDVSTAPGDSIIIWNWDFGDLSSSNLQSPTHVYSSCGTYIVSLFIQTSGSCGSSFSDTITVGTAINGSYTFTVDTTNGNTQFSTLPNNANYSYSWDFGDGNTGTGANPLHTYANGSYTACVTISDSSNVCGTDTVCQTINVTIFTPAPCASGFTFTDSANVYSFADTSNAGSGGTITNWLWNFGDFTTSSQQNPTHTYTSCGQYIVSLTIVTSPFCQSVFKDTIYVGGTINGSYTYIVDTTNGNTAFNASPNNPNFSYAWDFGDGNTGTTYNPTNMYANGTYNACVIITDNTGACSADTVCDSVVVNFIPPSQCPSNWNNFANGNNQTFTANPFGFGNTYAWDYGDGNTGNGFVSNHTYAASGTYTVCLTMTTGGGCTSVFCDTINIPPPLPCSLDFTWTGTAGNMTFTATTVNGGVFPIIAWSFGDMQTGFGNPVTHQYAANGFELVCAILNPGGLTGCSDTICHILIINGVVGIDEKSFSESVKLFPNPIEDQLSVQFNLSTAEDISVDLYDVLGNKVADIYNAKKQFGVQNILWKTSEISAGIYFVKIRAGEKIITRKIVKN